MAKIRIPVIQGETMARVLKEGGEREEGRGGKRTESCRDAHEKPCMNYI